MNPNTPQPSFELPAPTPDSNGESIAVSTEQIAARPETYTQPPVSQPAPSRPQAKATPAALQPATPVMQDQTQPLVTGSGPAVAEDSDLIEKEWVVKAKQIVAATREDPYLQNKEMSRFKADYLKKRYDKDIKLEES